MDYFSIFLGIVAIGFGIYILNARRNADYESHRLAMLQKMFGEKAGDTIHLIAYGFLPIFIGVLMFLKAFGYHI